MYYFEKCILKSFLMKLISQTGRFCLIYTDLFTNLILPLKIVVPKVSGVSEHRIPFREIRDIFPV